MTASPAESPSRRALTLQNANSPAAAIPPRTSSSAKTSGDDRYSACRFCKQLVTKQNLSRHEGKHFANGIFQPLVTHPNSPASTKLSEAKKAAGEEAEKAEAGSPGRFLSQCQICKKAFLNPAHLYLHKKNCSGTGTTSKRPVKGPLSPFKSSLKRMGLVPKTPPSSSPMPKGGARRSSNLRQPRTSSTAAVLAPSSSGMFVTESSQDR